MGRIFSIIAAISALMVLLAGSGAYWFSAAGAKEAERAAVSAVANGLASSISMQLSAFQQSVDGLAQSADVIAAFSSGNADILNATAAKLQGVVPQALRLRLLLPDIKEPDQTQLPHMGFGDLEMVRATLSSKQQPVIQGEGEHRHLAITSPVSYNQQVIGVLLVSLKPDLPQLIIGKTKFNDGLIELKQDQLVLANLGEADTSDDPESIALANSRWQINYWPDVRTSLGDIGLIAAIITIPALLACLAFFVGYRRLAEDLRKDQSSILKAAKDMMTGKIFGSYPVQLDEMAPIISTLAQFKRVIEQEGSPVKDDGESKEYDFFDESFDIDFLEDSPQGAEQASAPVIKSTAVQMPSYDDLNYGDLHLDSQPIATPAPVVPTATTATPTPPIVPTAAVPTAPAVFSTVNSAASTNIFGSYDIRGIVGKSLNEEIVTNIGRAFASEAKQLGVKSIVVARDGRTSSPALADAVIKGIVSTGCDVLDIGLAPTPVLYFVSHHSEGRSGVMITGSHDPADYNGLKLVLNGETLCNDRLKDISRRIDTEDYSQDAPGSAEKNSLFSNEYIGIISEDTHIVRPMTVVIDGGNGVAGQSGSMLLKTIGCDVIELFCEVDGHFPNHTPDPGKPENLDALIKAVKLNNADVGIAFDGDGDQLGVVDSSGKIIWPDRQMMLFARDVLASKPGAEILFDAECSKHLPEQIAKRGGRGIMSKSGQAAMQAKMRETGAVLAGEIDGHFYFNDRWFGFDDGLYAAARMIEILSADMRSSSELFSDLPDSINTPELSIPLAEGEKLHFIEQMFSLANFPDANVVNIDGMRVEFVDGWGLVRASNTKPSLVLRFEADTREAMSRIQAQFKYLMLQIKPDISLPF